MTEEEEKRFIQIMTDRYNTLLHAYCDFLIEVGKQERTEHWEKRRK